MISTQIAWTLPAVHTHQFAKIIWKLFLILPSSISWDLGVITQIVIDHQMSLLCSRAHPMQNIRSILENNPFTKKTHFTVSPKTFIIPRRNWKTNWFANFDKYILIINSLHCRKGFCLAWHMILGWALWGETCQENIWRNNILHPRYLTIYLKQYLTPLINISTVFTISQSIFSHSYNR